MAAVPTTEMILKNALITCSEAGIATLDKWREEVRALKKPSKRGKWHTRLWDRPGVAMKVRHTGEVRYFSIGGEHVPYEFEFYQQPHLVGGGVWYPIGDYKNYASKQGANPAAGFMTVANPTPPKKKCRDSTPRAARALVATSQAMSKELRDYFETIWGLLDKGGEPTEQGA